MSKCKFGNDSVPRTCLDDVDVDVDVDVDTDADADVDNGSVTVYMGEKRKFKIDRPL